MNPTTIKLSRKTATGYAIPVGPIKLVFVSTDRGFVGCGAFDVNALDKFEFPAACISGISSIDDLLAGKVRAVNEAGKQCGIEPGMTGREALERL